MNRQQFIQSGLHALEVASVAPMDQIRIMTEMVLGWLLQPLQSGEARGGAGAVDVEDRSLGVQLGLMLVTDDRDMNALFDQQAKHLPDECQESTMKTGNPRKNIVFVNM